VTLIQALDFASVFVFAIAGALTASRAQLDIFGFILIACVTGMGGGTFRDLVLDRTPVFWVKDPIYLVVAAAAAVPMFVLASKFENRLRALMWADAAGLAVAVTVGVAAARQVGASWLIMVLMGVVTGTFGGLARDVICNEVPLVLRREIYATAAFLGALAGVGAFALTEDSLLSALVCGGATFAIRAAALVFGWAMPLYKPRPPKNH
jgi:uncharacterized membrane protein YeiH